MSALYPWNHVEAKSTTSRSKAREAPLHRDGVHAYLPLRCSETSSPRAPGPWSRHLSAWRTRHSPGSSWTLGPLEPCISPFPPKAEKDIEVRHWIAAAYRTYFQNIADVCPYTGSGPLKSTMLFKVTRPAQKCTAYVIIFLNKWINKWIKKKFFNEYKEKNATIRKCQTPELLCLAPWHMSSYHVYNNILAENLSDHISDTFDVDFCFCKLNIFSPL